MMEEKKKDSAAYPYMVAIKFRNSTRPYSFGTADKELSIGEMVVVETSQGMEMGECVAVPVSTEKFPPSMPLKPVLRKANDDDMRMYEENVEFAEEAFHICQEEINNLQLGMNLQSADYMLDRSKILFIYVADQRVDFRELLRRLNYRLHCKIELRQIGERDKAKMIGGIGMCGMECCCSRFKSRFDVISINMAKNQLLALNIDKLSGMCGKLMCCLKFEDENYKELTQGLPKMGAHVEYEGELYKVTSMNVMTNEARIENSETYQILSIEDLKTKAEVRKGVTLAKRGNRPPKNGGHTAPKPAVKTNEKRTPKPEELSDLSFASSPAFQARQLNANARKNNGETRSLNKNSNAETRSLNKNSNTETRSLNKNKAGSNKPNNQKKPNKPVSLKESAKNNPNVTVRSFKSSKTKASEAKGEQK